MTPRLLWMLALSPLLCGAGCAQPGDNRSSGDVPPPSGYVLTIDDATSDEASYTVTVNGFPVAWGAELRGATFGGDYAPDPAYGERVADLNPGLVGDDEVRVVIEPDVDFAADGVTAKWLRGEFRVLALPGARGLNAEVVAGPLNLTAAFDAWLNDSRPQWRRWDVPQQADLDAIVASGRQPTPDDIWIDDSVSVWIERNPLVLTATFDSQLSPHDADRRRENQYLFREAPVLTDTARVRAFAVRLLGLLRDGDLAAAGTLFQPPYSDGSVQADEVRQGLDDLLNALAEHGDLDVGAAEIGMQPWAGGRVWEVYRRENPAALSAGRDQDADLQADALLQAEVPRSVRTEPSLPSSASEFPEVPAAAVQRVRRRMYVAEVNGKLYVVR